MKQKMFLIMSDDGRIMETFTDNHHEMSASEISAADSPEKQAENQAKQLAKQHGQGFCVYIPVKSFAPQIPIIERPI